MLQPPGAALHCAQAWPTPAVCLTPPPQVHYVVGSTMVVRAVEDVAAAGEVTISYMAREEFAPAGVV